MSHVLEQQLEFELGLPVPQVDINHCLKLFDALRGNATTDKEALSLGETFLPQLAEAHAAKAIYILERTLTPYPQQDDPPFQLEWLYPFMRRYQHIDLSPFLGSAPNDYPEEREAVTTFTELSLAEAEEYMRDPIEVSHSEDVTAWSASIHSTLSTTHGSMRFSELLEHTSLTHAELTLGVLLGGFSVEQLGWFYDQESLAVSLE